MQRVSLVLGGTGIDNTGKFEIDEATGNVNFDSGSFFFDAVNDKMGVGNSVPDALFQVTSASSGGSPNANFDEAAFEGSGHSGITLLGGATSNTGIAFGDSGSSIQGRISYDNNLDQLDFFTNGSRRALITSAGNVIIGAATGAAKVHIVTGSSGGGVPNTSADELAIEASGNGGITIITPDASEGVLAFRGASGEYASLQGSYNGSLITLNSFNNSGLIHLNARDSGSTHRNVINATAATTTISSAGSVQVTVSSSNFVVNSSLESVKSQSAVTNAKITNSNGGTAAQSNFILFNGTDTASTGLTGTGYTSTITWDRQRAAYLQNEGPGGISIAAREETTGIITLHSGGNSVRATLAANGGFFMAGAVGGSKGPGTINATDVFDDGAGPLTDYVIDFWVDGVIDLAAYDAITPNRHWPAQIDKTGNVIAEAWTEIRQHDAARGFASVAADRLDIEKLGAYLRRWRHLPAFPKHNLYTGTPEKLSVGALNQRTVETCELLLVHLLKQHEEIKSLKARLSSARIP